MLSLYCSRALEEKPESLHGHILLAKILFLSDRLFLAQNYILRALKPEFDRKPELEFKPELELDPKFGPAYKLWKRVWTVEALTIEAQQAKKVEDST